MALPIPEKIRASLSRVAVAFSSGAIGGLCIGLAVPLLAAAGLMDVLGIAIHPQLTPPFVYQKVVWGGIWGFILLIPFNTSTLVKGALFGTPCMHVLLAFLACMHLLGTPGFILLIPFNTSTLVKGALFGMPAFLALFVASELLRVFKKIIEVIFFASFNLLLIVFPLKETPGFLAGLSLGPLTPLLVLFLNAFVWGVPSALAYALLRPPSPQSFVSIRALGESDPDLELQGEKFS
ncbi:unnamed protein product [Closterium sp. NIES-53]